MDGGERPTLPRVAFWYLRHGETDWNVQGISQGNVDVPLNSTGLAQARSAAVHLKNRAIATIVSSPLSRARVTAEIVAEALRLPLRIDDGLREVAFGAQEGAPMANWFARWIDGSWTPAGAETFCALRRRAVGAVTRCLSLPPVVLIVAHGALFRALRAEMGLETNLRTRNAMAIYCDPTREGWRLREVA